MARTAVTATAATPGAMLARPAGTTIDAALVTAGVSISGVPLEELVVEITQATAATDTMTFQSGANPPALSAGQGDLTGDLAQNEVGVFGPFSSARFAQADGSLWVDFSAGTTGTIRAYHVGRNA